MEAKRMRIAVKPRWETSNNGPRTSSENSYVVFSFRLEKPNSRLTVPNTWIVQPKENECYWPVSGSTDAKRICNLIREHSEPNKITWLKLPGRVKGTFSSYFEAEKFIDRNGTSESDSDRIQTLTSRVSMHERVLLTTTPNLDATSNADYTTATDSLVPRAYQSTYEDLSNMLGVISGTVNGLRSSVDVVNNKLDKLIAQHNGEKHSKRMVGLEAMEVLKNFGLPLTETEQLSDLEGLLNCHEKRSELKLAIASLTPKTTQSLISARAVVRIIAPDKLMQHFRLDHARKVNKEKIPFSTKYPKIFDTIVSVIVHKTAKGIDASTAALGRHFTKCSDRKSSKEFLNISRSIHLRQSDSDSESDDHDTEEIESDTST